MQGPYAHRVFVEELGASPSTLINSVPKDDFNGGHADPNLTYAKDLIKVLSHQVIEGLAQKLANQRSSTHSIVNSSHELDVLCVVCR